MALILDLDPQPTAQWVSDRRICLNDKGVICSADDPAAQLLLVAEGGQIDLAEAVRHGLATADGQTIPGNPEGKQEEKKAAPRAPAKTTPKAPPKPTGPDPTSSTSV